MNDTTDVRFWDVRRNKSSRSASYEVRWVVGGRQFSKTRATKALAESFLSELRQAAKRGEAFDISRGTSGVDATCEACKVVVRVRTRVRRYEVAVRCSYDTEQHDGCSRYGYRRARG